jgi:hypothetical protein
MIENVHSKFLAVLEYLCFRNRWGSNELNVGLGLFQCLYALFDEVNEFLDFGMVLMLVTHHQGFSSAERQREWELQLASVCDAVGC